MQVIIIQFIVRLKRCNPGSSIPFNVKNLIDVGFLSTGHAEKIKTRGPEGPEALT